MNAMALSALATVLALAVYLRQDGVRSSPDGVRYESGLPQPAPFYLRFHAWPRRLLTACTWVALVFVAASLGDLRRAVLFITLPGVWWLATRPTCVDGVSMALAWGASLVLPHDVRLALVLALASGFVMERGPVFAAIYAGNPLLLLGLVAAGWWRKARAPTEEERAAGLGESVFGVVWTKAPRYQDWLDWRTNALPLRAVVPLAAWGGTLGEPRSLLALGAALACRAVAVGADNSRFMLWVAPPLLANLDAPWWIVVVHVMTFQRCA